MGLLVLAYGWLDPNPPKTVTLATGPAQSAYEEFGKRYQKALAVDSIDVVLHPSDGSSHNLQLLRDSQVDVAFVQGGTAELRPGDTDQLVSLGSLFVEPVWVFYRTDAIKKRASNEHMARLDGLQQLKGLRVNVGTPGSGVPTLMERLLEASLHKTHSACTVALAGSTAHGSSQAPGTASCPLPKRVSAPSMKPYPCCSAICRSG